MGKSQENYLANSTVYPHEESIFQRQSVLPGNKRTITVLRGEIVGMLIFGHNLKLNP